MANEKLQFAPKIAIAVSGVGHIYRGMEGWALFMATALAENNYNFTLFRGAGPELQRYDKHVSCIHRTSKKAGFLVKLFRKIGWRFGFGSTGQLEAWTFGVMLLFKLFKNKYDLLHIKQGNLGIFLDHAKRLKLLKTPFVISNGQIAKPKFINRFDYVQFLSPYERDEMTKALGSKKGWFVIPNFVDVELFRPLPQEECRKRLGIPKDDVVILTVAAIKRYHKRIDYFLKEGAQLTNNTDCSMHFIIAGSKSDETDELIAEGRKLLGDRLSVYFDIPKTDMPKIYSAADVFVLCSLKEAFGNVYIEAMSCGLPVIYHTYAVHEWIMGKGGQSADLEHEGNLNKAILSLIERKAQLKEIGEAGRARVIQNFSKEVVLGKTFQMYKKIIEMETNKKLKN